MAQAGQTSPGRALGVMTATPSLDGLTVGNANVTAKIDLGYAATDLVGMYGATPVVQRATAASHTVIATTVAVSTTTAIWGFSTSTQANALTAAVAEIQATLSAIGMWG